MPTPAANNPFEIIRFDAVDSTSLHARRDIESGSPIESPRVYVAATQTGGIGQRGRTWLSPTGGLWCTFVVPWIPPFARGDLRGDAVGTLGVRLGLACVSTIHEIVRAGRASVAISLKLPNDVLLNSKKVLGILTEIIPTPNARHYVLVGVGINANFMPSDLSPTVAPTATTLRAVVGRDVELERLLQSLAKNVLDAIDSRPLESAELVAVRATLHHRGRPARVVTPSGLTVEGVLEGVDATGGVVVSTPTGPATGVLSIVGDHAI